MELFIKILEQLVQAQEIVKRNKDLEQIILMLRVYTKKQLGFICESWDEYISSDKIGLLLDNLKTILPKKDIDLLNKSFEKSDNETIISLLENILKDFDAK